MHRPRKPAPEQLRYHMKLHGWVHVPENLRKAVMRFNTPDKTYFIECGGRVKIGKTVDLKRRVDDLCTGMPYPPTVLCCVPAYVVTEAAAHAKWSHLRRHHEWFEDAPELRKWIKTLPVLERAANGRIKRVLAVLERRATPAGRYLFAPLDELRRVERVLKANRLYEEQNARRAA